jgi:hypothetical protein
MAAMRRCYEDILGFHVRRELSPDWIEYQVGENTLTLARPSRTAGDAPIPKGSASLQLAFRVSAPEVDQCAEETGGRTFPPIQYGVDLRPAWAVAVQARLGEEWRIVEDFEVTVLHVKEVSAPETGLHLEKEDGARSMLYTLCIHCQTNHVIPEPDTPEVEPACPDCGKALGVLGLALKGDDEEDAAD